MPEEVRALSSADVMRMYHRMWMIRKFEEAAGSLYTQGKVKGGIHASIGQEGVAVGVAFALEAGDFITSTHRGHGHHIAKGADLRRLMAEILGRETGCCKGRGGSMHVADFSIGSLGAYAVVGAGVPVAVGAALSLTLQKIQNVVAAFFGDGALGQGTVYESFNLASIWKLPVIFVCERNQYAVSTRTAHSVATTNLIPLAADFGMRGLRTDGKDVIATYAAAKEAADAARCGKGPLILECVTYRVAGHYFGEPQVYRTKEEVEEARRLCDPITYCGRTLREIYGLSAEELKTAEKDAEAEVEAAVAFALASPPPDPDSFAEYVYA